MFKISIKNACLDVSVQRVDLPRYVTDSFDDNHIIMIKLGLHLKCLVKNVVYI